MTAEQFTDTVTEENVRVGINVYHRGLNVICHIIDTRWIGKSLIEIKLDCISHDGMRYGRWVLADHIRVLPPLLQEIQECL